MKTSKKFGNIFRTAILFFDGALLFWDKNSALIQNKTLSKKERTAFDDQRFDRERLRRALSMIYRLFVHKKRVIE